MGINYDLSLASSMRFFPIWDRDNISQITGLINLIEYVFDTDPNSPNWVEVGTLCGESASIMLGFSKIKKLDCIDSWTICPGYVDSATPGDFRSAKNIFFARLSQHINTKRCVPYHFDSISASKLYVDNSINVVYVDADHNYDFVLSDLETWFPKVKPGGFLCGHDYHVISDAWPDVKRAVDDFVIKYSLESPILFEDSSFLLRKQWGA